MSRITARRLLQANALLRRTVSVLHDLPDYHCPITLLGDIRLHLHRTQAGTAAQSLTLGETMFNEDPRRLDGPDFLQAVADAEEANGLLINAAEYRRRANEWKRDREVLAITKPRIRVPRELVSE